MLESELSNWLEIVTRLETANKNVSILPWSIFLIDCVKDFCLF